MSCVSTRQMSWLLTRHMSYVSTLMPSVHSQRKGNRSPSVVAEGRTPSWRRPKSASFMWAGSTGHVLVLRRKTCALLRAKTSALLSGKTCAVLRAGTCALFRAAIKETTEGGGRRPPPSVVAAEGRHLCIGSEQSTCPSFQHNTCLASHKADVLALNKAHV